MGPVRIPRGVEDRFWAAWSQGLGVVAAAAAAGVSERTGHSWVRQRGGVKPNPHSSGNDLTIDERVKIESGIAAGHSNAQIARTIGRSPSTVGRELQRNVRPSDVGPANKRRGYRAVTAQQRAEAQRRRPKLRKVDTDEALFEYVQHRLDNDWSPEQIANRMRLDYGEDPQMRISHEAIYQAIYVNTAGCLRRELKAKLRTGRPLRKPRARSEQRRSRMPDMAMIVDRPDEANGRAVPGHWEGDLITGKLNQTAVGTLVDRCSRYTMLLHLPEDHSADTVRDAMTEAVQRMPERLRRTVTWDQGIEMAKHLEITDTTGVKVYFCDPHSPWQRPTNENTNGLLRQYLPKGTDLSVHAREHLDTYEDNLNNRPRKTLGWLTPIEYLTQVLEEDITVALTD